MHIHVDGGRSIDSRDLLDGEYGQKNPSTRAAVLLRNFDAHEPELEESWNQLRPELGRLVHRVHVRLHVGLGELADRIPEHGFFFGQGREGGCARYEGPA